MEIKTYYLILLFCFGVTLVQSQNNQNTYETTTYLYKPKNAIKSIIKNILKNPKCFQNKNKSGFNVHSLSFSYDKKKGYYAVLGSSSTLIKGNLKRVEDLNFSGAFYYKNNLVLINFENEPTKKTMEFFRITSNKIEIKVPVADSPDLYCISIYQINNYKFELLDMSESWNIFVH